MILKQGGLHKMRESHSGKSKKEKAKTSLFFQQKESIIKTK
jgi:hypothetical protein